MIKRLVLPVLVVLFTVNLYAQKKGDKQKGKIQEVIYKTVSDSINLKMHLHYPSSFKKKKKYPTIVFFFGGGWNGGTITQFEDQAKYFASRGMIGVLVNYRVKNKHKTTPFESVKDAKSAMRYLKINADKFNIDVDKMVASGGSAGGHLAAATTLLSEINEQTDDLSISPKANALILYNPVIDNSKAGYGYERIGERYLEFSPMHNINEGAPPTIFFLGSKDKLIPVSTAYNYKDKMEAVGSRCDVFIYENQPHGFFNKWKADGEYYIKTTREADLFLQSLGFISGKVKL